MRQRIFYGWKMVAAATGMQFLQAGLMMQAFGAYVAVRAGVLLFGIGLMLFSQVETLPTFYAAFVVIALGVGFCGFFPLNVAIIHWFERRRARAISSMSIGLAFGGIIVPLVAWSMEVWGWRSTAFASGVIVMAAGSWLASKIYNRPEDKGEVVDGIAEERSSKQFISTGENSVGRDFTAREALRTPAFWLLSLGHGFALFVVQAVVVHAIAHLKEGLGYTVAQA